MATADFPTLPTGPLPHAVMDWARLRAEGLELLGRLAGRQWTDYNTHDPGITILEQLCYALTDLGYRIHYPMADLLAAGRDLGLPGPTEILTGDPVTRADVRKLVLDLEGIGNAWVEDPSEPAIPFYHHLGSGELRFEPDAAEPNARPVRLRGLHRVLLQTTDRPAGDPLPAVAARLHRSRLLGDDFELSRLSTYEIWVRASVEVGPIDDPVGVLADIMDRLDRYLAPPATFSTFGEARARGTRIDTLFEGPLLTRGFVDELPPPRRRVYVSDLIHTIMDAQKVRALKTIEVATSPSSPPERWILEIPAGNIATLSPSSELTLLREGLPISVDLTDVRARIEQRRLARATATSDMRELDPPLGRDRELALHHSIQRQLPAAYGVGPLGLPSSAPAWRRAQARQLESYLLIFDQLLANAFAQLAHAHELLSPDQGGTRTYFAQPVEDAPLPLAELVTRDPAAHRAWLDSAVESGDPLERRKRFLAHLLARFAEHIGDHTHATMMPHDADQRIVADRQTFLRRYPRLSGARGSGFDLNDETLAPSGFEERLRLKLGYGEDQRFYVVEHILLRPLAEDSGQLGEEGEERVPLLAGVESADPWSQQITFVFHEPAESDPQLERLVSQTILAETPAHLAPQLLWFGAADRVDHWAQLKEAWAEFREHHREYRAAKLRNTRVDDELHLRARDARDRVIDLLGFGRTYPLRDVLVREQVIVAPGAPASVIFDFSQRGVIYELRHRDTGEAILLNGQPIRGEGTGGTLELPTPPITEDVSYRILAVKIEGAEQPELRRAAWLRRIVRIEEGVDRALDVQLRLPLLDPRIDNPKPSDARIADYGASVVVEVLASQEGVQYEVLDHADQRRVLSAAVVGTSTTIAIALTNPVTEDIDLRVRGRKDVGDPQHPEVRTAVLDVIMPLRVRANPGIAASVATAIVAHGGTSSIRIGPMQATASYRVHERAVRDRDVAFDTSVPTIDVRDGTRTIRIVRPERTPVWAELPGFARLGDLIEGTTGSARVALGPRTRDWMFLIEAIKEHRNGPLESDAEKISSSVQLERALVLLVRPDHQRVIRIEAAIENGATAGPWLVADGQPGVYYELRAANGDPIARPAYFHQRDDEDASLNKGVDHLRVEVDLAIARDGVVDRAATPPPLPLLEVGAIAAGSVISAQAKKAMTGLEATLDRRATIDPVPAVSADPASVTAGAAAKIVVDASVAQDRYTLLRGDEVIAGPVDGNGGALRLETGAIAEATRFTVAIERAGDQLRVVRKVGVEVQVS